MSRAIHIFLVEDNPGDVGLTREALSGEGLDYRLTVACDAVEALERLRESGEEPPDLVLLDLSLPRGNGFEVLERIKTDPRLRSVPVVVLTSSADEDDVRRAYDLQANCYVTKPLEAARLRPILHLIEHFWTTVVKLPPRETS